MTGGKVNGWRTWVSALTLLLLLFPLHAFKGAPDGPAVPSSTAPSRPVAPLAADGDVVVYYVDAINGSDTTGDGSETMPWRTITHALSHVAGPDVEIHVAPGTYDEALGESFPLTMEPGVSLIGAGPATTVIAGNGTNSVILFSSAAVYTETTVLSGFQITNGSEGVRVDGTGGSGQSPIIRGNWIRGNRDGIRLYVGESARRIYAHIEGNQITDNTRYGICAYADPTSGKTYVNPTIKDNRIVGNGADGIYCYAHGASSIDAAYCSPQITGNLIAENGGNGVRAAARYAGICAVHLTGNVIAHNQGWGLRRNEGPTEYWTTVTPRLINNLIYGNGSGGAIFHKTDQAFLLNNTIADNGAYGVRRDTSGSRSGSVTIVNTIVWGHDDDLNNIHTSQVSYSDIGDGEYGSTNHNLSVDPLFADPLHDDYHLLPTSPLLDAGDATQPDLPASDIDGDARLLADGVEIGADETLPYSVSIAKSVQPTGTVALDSILTYTLVLTNGSPASAGGTLVTDTLPTEVTWTGDVEADGGHTQVQEGTLKWQGTIPASTTYAITLTVRVNAGLPTGTLITNTAWIDDRSGGITETNAVTVTTGPTVVWRSSQQTVSQKYVRPGQPITYTLRISNTGNIPATNAIVTDTLDPHVTFRSASAGGTLDNGRVVWHGLTITDGTGVTLTVAVTVHSPLTDALPLVNRVEVVEAGDAPFALPTEGATAWVYNPPSAGFEVTPTLGPVPLEVSLLDTSQHATEYLWDYGDGTISTLPISHTHIYTKAGFYTVTLRVANPVGTAALTRTRCVTVYNPPRADFTAVPRKGLWPLTVTFTNTSRFADTFIWDYGDGTTSTITAPVHTHVYTAPGFYDVALTAIGPYSEDTLTREAYIAVYDPPVASFDATPVTGVAPLLVDFHNYSLNGSTYRWDFGDGSISYAEEPSHLYLEGGVYTVTLRASNPGGSDTLIRPAYITVHNPPVAGFYADRTAGLVPMTVTFTNTSRFADTFLWNYGDGTTSTVTATVHTHVYTTTGQFTVSLTAMSPYGQDVLARPSYVAVYTYPIAGFTATPLTGVAPLRVVFTNTSQHATAFRWDFGDGTTSTGFAPTHEYLAGGVYTVSLRASNPVAYAILTRTRYITVFDRPLPDFVGRPRIGFAPLTVTFTNTSQFADAFLWDYGDGTTSTVTATTHVHVYTEPGIYTVTLTAHGLHASHTTARAAYVATLLPASPAPSEVYFVDVVNGDDAAGDGSVDAPWRTVSHALGQTLGPDVWIYVAPGQYDEAAGETFPITMRARVHLIGPSPLFTVLRGNGTDPVILFSRDAIYTATTVISGFLITNGSAGIRIEGRTDDPPAPTIRGNRITGNGDGVSLYATSGERVSGTVRDNWICANSRHGIYSYAGYWRTRVTTEITYNQICSNGSNGIYCYAQGAAYGDESFCSPTIVGNRIFSNTQAGFLCKARYAGACNTEFIGNFVAYNGSTGIDYSPSDAFLTAHPFFANNIIVRNGDGGARFYPASHPLFLNNTVAYNGSYGIHEGSPTLVNCIVWGHDDDLDISPDQVTYSDVGDAEYAGTNHNIWVDPAFVDPATDDFHLSPTSPLIDAGDTTHPDLPATDFDGDPRILKEAVDIGADEVPFFLKSYLPLVIRSK